VFEEAAGPTVSRAELGLDANALVLGHVGRFDPQKNHAFLIQIAREAVRLEPRTQLLLIGVGALRPVVERQVADAGLTGRVLFAGGRDDVPALMRRCMDVFVLPSLYEGLGIVGLEAQAAGLPVVAADVVPSEMDVAPGMVRRLSLSESATTWAKAALAAAAGRLEIDQAAALAQVKSSPFNIRVSAQQLEELYHSAAAARVPARFAGGRV
jgi:glycosyltransferase involved in cell wall biosynthesis